MFLVIKMPQMGVGEFEIADRWVMFNPPTNSVNDSKEGGDGNLYRRSIYRANTGEDARALAAKLVEENPGYEIWIATASTVMQGTKPEVIEKRITENGVLPA